MSKPTQATRVLAALARAGDRGVTQGDWLPHGGLDGRGKITRLAARIEELRKDGVAIVRDGKRDGFAVYRLVIEASSQPAKERVAPEGWHLFDLPAERSTSTSHWRDVA